jgi:hypothetical protein
MNSYQRGLDRLFRGLPTIHKTNQMRSLRKPPSVTEVVGLNAGYARVRGIGNYPGKREGVEVPGEESHPK